MSNYCIYVIAKSDIGYFLVPRYSDSLEELKEEVESLAVSLNDSSGIEHVFSKWGEGETILEAKKDAQRKAIKECKRKGINSKDLFLSED